jgi:serine/threonine protein kinase
MDNDDLEIHNLLPHYNDHEGALLRKFGSYQGDLVLVTEFSPPLSSAIDVPALAESMTDINRSVEDDFIFDYRGTFVCRDEMAEDKSMLKSMVLFPEGGILSGLIFSDIKLGWSFRIQIAINVARALCHLHNNGIVHNDVHPQALALDSEWTCKLLDMFYAVRVDDIYSLHSLTEMKNDSAYAAPEVHMEGKCSAASDIYSFGLCLFEICSRVLVTSIHKNADLYRDDSAADVVLDHLPESIPDSLRELIRQMISLDAEYRPTIEDVLDWLESLLTETCLDDDPPLPPLPKLPFPDRRKSSRMARDMSFNMNSPTKPFVPLAEPQLNAETDSSSSPDRRAGRGGGYAISRTDADRLKSLAKAKRDTDEGGSGSTLSGKGGGLPPPPSSSSSSSSESTLASSIMLGVAMDSELPDIEGYLQLKVRREKKNSSDALCA